MPFVRISLIKGKNQEHIRAISDAVQRGLVEAYGVPKDDKFQIITQHERDEVIYDSDYLGIHRTDDLVVIHIVAGNWRETPKKKALFRSITDNLVLEAGLRPEDVLIVLSPNAKDEWSFGNGLASYVSEDA
jgi:phenylpyruvate tautomerase PptA (4-oxalocrotonate tautomerase family)